MTSCDHCFKSERWPGPINAEMRTTGWHHDKGINTWHFDLCKDCALLLKQELDALIGKFVKQNLKKLI